eukprot:13097054-Alexandrium_andersonii.AAC.1
MRLLWPKAHGVRPRRAPRAPGGPSPRTATSRLQRTRSLSLKSSLARRATSAVALPAAGRRPTTPP